MSIESRSKNSIKILIRAILAGMMISVGCVIYSMCVDKIVGAVLFSFGLFTICSYGLNLYTGKIGYLVSNRSRAYLAELVITVAGNFIGAFFVAALLWQSRIAPKLLDFIGPVVECKNGDSFGSLFVLSFFCGVLMFLGVDIFKTSPNPVSKVLAVVFAVSIFILAGFEHCVANMFYLIFAKDIDWPRLLMMIFGNSVGGIFTALCTELVRIKI